MKEIKYCTECCFESDDLASQICPHCGRLLFLAYVTFYLPELNINLAQKTEQ